MKLTPNKKKDFQDIVWKFFYVHKRDHLPWRGSNDAYRVLVSELMLQQTQVDRVISKYEAFIKKWPNTKVLARASLSEVLKSWQGLGYNRRAKYLHQAAAYIEGTLDGVFPTTEEALLQLPGVGPYTASAVVAFAFNKKTVLVETNVRQVIIYHFFMNEKVVDEKQVHDLVAQTLPKENYRNWYAALMDYGSHLKRQHGNLGKKSNQYKKQSGFEGSDRQIRGAIIRLLIEKPLTLRMLQSALDFESDRISAQVEKLLLEDFLKKKGSKILLT